MYFTQYTTVVSVLVLALCFSTLVTATKRKKPKLQTDYVSKNQDILQFLQYLPAAAIATAEQDFFVRVEGSKYAISFMPMNFFKAYQMCRRRGGYSVEADDTFIPAANLLLKARSPEHWKYWTSASSMATNNTFKSFHSGLAVKPTRWAAGEPTLKHHSCVLLERSPTGFSEKAVNCYDKKAHALCEIFEKHVHSHANVEKRRKLRTSKMKTLFDY